MRDPLKRFAIHGNDSKSFVPLFDVIWENPLEAPINEYGAHTLSIANLSDYNLFMFEFGNATGTDNPNVMANFVKRNSVIIYVPEDYEITSQAVFIDSSGNAPTFYVYKYTRGITISRFIDTVVFTIGMKHTISNNNITFESDNSVQIPLRILGTRI